MAELIFLGIPTLITAILLIQIYLGVKSFYWPNTDGTLIDFRIIKKTYPPKFPSVQDTVELGIIKVRYKYSVKGKTYFCSKYDYNNSNCKNITEIEADEYIKNIRNNNFKVFYCQRFPSIAVLRVTKVDLQSGIWAIVFILFSGIFFYFVYRMAIPFLK